MQVEYAGKVYADMMNYLSVSDGFSFGQKLAQIEKTAKKRFYEMTDEEIYRTQRELIADKGYFKDEKLTDQEFENWVSKK